MQLTGSLFCFTNQTADGATDQIQLEAPSLGLVSPTVPIGTVATVTAVQTPRLDHLCTVVPEHHLSNLGVSTFAPPTHTTSDITGCWRHIRSNCPGQHASLFLLELLPLL